MLRSLRVRNLVILEDVTLEFDTGLNVLTGETGAGKSILVDAVGLATGERADRGLVRGGAAAAVVEALFDVASGGPVAGWAAERGIDLEGDELLVRREVAAAGTNRARINGSPCTQGMLGELGARLLELHGQHEQQSLLSADRHLELLDRWGGNEALLDEVAEASREWHEKRGDLDALGERIADRDRRIGHLQAIVREIDDVSPLPGEFDELTRECRLLRNGARMAGILDALVEACYEGERSAAALLAAAARSGAAASDLDPALADLAARLASAAVEVEDIGAGFRDYRDGANFDPSRVERLEERRAAIERLLLRHGRDEAEVLAVRDAARAELDQLADVEQALRDGERALDEASRRYVTGAAALGRARREAAARLGPVVEVELRDLALGRARIDVAFTAAVSRSTAGADAVPVTDRGAERAELLLAANPGEPFRPLRKVASGGELSRLMLALHGVFESAGEGRALVFDEVDAGVGGAVADAVGRRLATLARRHQVLCVTHLPQVAAWADRHFAVQKTVQDGRTRAVVAALERDERVEEIARMLGGEEATEVARRHAVELLDLAAGRRDARARRPSRARAGSSRPSRNPSRSL